MNIQYWHTYFDTDYDPMYLPAWHCPVCLKGILHRSENSVKIFVNEAFKRKWKNESIDDGEGHGNFVGVLTCNNKNCKENIMFSGLMFGVPEVNQAEDDVDVVEHISPRYFNPALRILPYQSYYPKEVEDALLKSYEVFWIENAACAGAIRKVVEVIMTDRGIPKTTINKNHKRVILPLNQRIDKFRVKNPEVSEMLEAIKWIGNDGSHAQDELKRDDIWKAYDILEHGLEKLYNQEHKIILKAAKAINKSKGIKRPKEKFKFGIR